MNDKSSEIKPIAYLCNGKTLTFNRPLIMAIVNITPDSFYDGGKYSRIDDILNDVEDKINQGADIIDIGAASSRPGASEISESEEWLRLKEVLPEIRKRFANIFISVDTFQSGIAKKCADEGVDMINDISGGCLDVLMLDTIAELNLPYILMHMDGSPSNMNKNSEYKEVAQEVKTKIQHQIHLLNSKGFEKIIIDPGFGFGKSLKNNYELLKHLDSFQSLGYPILSGLSRKSMINKIIHTNPVTSLNGTTVLNTIALLNGSNILRVHDVVEAKQTIELVSYYQNV